MRFSDDWLRTVRVRTQSIVPVTIPAGMLVEFAGLSTGSTVGAAYNWLKAVGFSLLTVALIVLCAWIVFLWDIDRLFFRLERRIDTEIGLESASEASGSDASLVSRARETVSSKLQGVRAQAISVIQKAYWDDINAGRVLAFPQPDIGAAIEQLDTGRRDLLAPPTDHVATALPLGSTPAAIVARMIFRNVAPEVKVRLYRRLVLRFIFQLATLFGLTALCFYLSILGWSRVTPTIFNGSNLSVGSVLFYQLDLMLRGALFDFMEHTQRSISPIRINQGATLFVYYTLLFRIFVAVYFFSSLFRVIRFVARRWRVLLR